jgi:hypothetical protein
MLTSEGDVTSSDLVPTNIRRRGSRRKKRKEKGTK